MKSISANDFEIIEQRKQNWIKKKQLEKAKVNSLNCKSKKFKKAKVIANTNIKDVAKDFANRLRQFPTKAEEYMLKILNQFGIECLFQHPVFIMGKGGLIEKFYIADFFIPSGNLIIEVDGGYHGIKKQTGKDICRTSDICRHYPGIKVMRITNKETFNSLTVSKFMLRVKDRIYKLYKK